MLKICMLTFSIYWVALWMLPDQNIMWPEDSEYIRTVGNWNPLIYYFWPKLIKLWISLHDDMIVFLVGLSFTDLADHTLLLFTSPELNNECCISEIRFHVQILKSKDLLYYLSYPFKSFKLQYRLCSILKIKSNRFWDSKNLTLEPKQSFLSNNKKNNNKNRR